MLCRHYLQGVVARPPRTVVVMPTQPIHTVRSVRVSRLLGGIAFFFFLVFVNDPFFRLISFADPVDQKEQQQQQQQHNTANTAMSAGSSSSASTTNLFQPKFSSTNNYNYNSFMTYSNPVVITGSTGTTTIINSPP